MSEQLTAEELTAQEQKSYEDDFDSIVAGEQAPEAAKEGKEGTDDGQTSNSEKVPSDKDPEQAGDTSSASKGNGADSGNSGKSDNDDGYGWIDELPEEVRQQAQRLRHRAVSDAGRARSALTRLEEYRAREAARAREARSQQQSDSSEAPNEQTSDLPEDFKKFQEEYPELAGQLMSVVEHKLKSVESQVEERIKPLRETLTTETIRKDLAQFESKAAELLDTANTGVTYKDVAESEEFDAWLTTKPERYQQVARTSTNPEDALDVLNSFLEHSYVQEMRIRSTSEPTKAEQKKEKLKSNAIPSSRSAPTDGSGGASSYEDDFDSFA